MTDEFETTNESAIEAKKKFPVLKLVLAFFACLLLMAGGAAYYAFTQIDKRIKSAVEEKLAKIEGLSYELGTISFDATGILIDRLLLRPANHPDKSVEFQSVRVNVDYRSLMSGAINIDPLLIKRVNFQPDLIPALDNVSASIDLSQQPRVQVKFTGELSKGKVSGTIALDRQPMLVVLDADLRGEGLSLQHPRISRLPLESIEGDIKASIRYDKNMDLLRVENLTLSSRGLSAVLLGQIEELKAKPRVTLTLTVPSVPCQTLLGALPVNFVPDLQGFQLNGNYAAEFKLNVDFDNLDGTQFQGYRGFRDCKTVSAPDQMSSKHFQRSFEHTTRLTVGQNQTFIVGPENPRYVPYSHMSAAIKAAFVATEDIGFFYHRGFVPESLSFAIGQNLSENRFAMGGSTITMQMVKNVFLSHEKTLSRKVQELFLTDYVEQTLGKQRIMEIYLNVIEFGPGIFGIGAAAEYYFGKSALALNPLESTFLASIIYSPRRHQGSYCRGAITPKWDQRLCQLLQLMHNKALISEDDFLASEAESIVFRRPALGCG